MIDQISGDFLQWVRGFYYVAERGGVTQAAAAMGREQPTITHQIKRLEKELGVTLFDRASGRMRLTPEGRVLLEKAISLFEIVRDIKSEFQHQEQRGRIALAASHGIIDTFLPRYITSFRKDHPDVDFHMMGGVYETVFERVESTEADFGIAYLDSVPDSMISHDLFDSGVVLICGKDSNFFSGRAPTLKQVAETPLILFSRTGAVEPFIERRFAKEKLQPKIVMTHNNPVSVKKYVTLGLGAALLSGFSVSDEDRRALRIYNMDRYFQRRKYGLVLRKRKYLPPYVKSFIRTIKPDIQFS